MTEKMISKLIHVGSYAVEVEVNLIDDGLSWSPSISLQDAYKLDDVRAALSVGDVSRAALYGKVYILTPVAI